jgi:hypothetical protein
MTGHFAKLLHPMMSRKVQPVFAPGSGAIFARAWRAGLRIAVNSRARRRAAAAVDGVVITDAVSRFNPPTTVLGVPGDSCSMSLGDS